MEKEKRQQHLRVPVTQLEKEAVESQAKNANLSVAAFLRAVGLGYNIKSRLDIELTQEFIRAAANQARLGGLFKLALSEAAFTEELEKKVRDLLHDIEKSQLLILELIEKFQNKNFSG